MYVPCLQTGLCFSRAEPRHKQDIVRLLKDMGEVTAMTGDGVNDAPALKLAGERVGRGDGQDGACGVVVRGMRLQVICQVQVLVVKGEGISWHLQMSS